MPGGPHLASEERIALRAMAAFADTAEAGGALVMTAPEAPASPMLNRIVGLGVGRPATESDLDEALAAVGAGVTYYVAVSPAARPAQMTAWLRARGLAPGWGWMRFRRAAGDPPPARTSLRLAEVADPAAAAAFAVIVREGYGLPEAIEARLARVPERGWSCWVAYDGDEPASAAALFAQDGVGYLGFAATRAEHRGKGAQSALLAARIRRAQQLGCGVLVTETGERQADRPSNSYRNILRAGFEEVAVTAHWLGGDPAR